MLMRLIARRHGLRPVNSPLGRFESRDGSKLVWREYGQWHAFGCDRGPHAMRDRGFDRLRDAARYANYARPEIAFPDFPH